MAFRFSLRFLLGLTFVGAVVLLLAYNHYTNLSPKRLATELRRHGARPIVLEYDAGFHTVEKELTVEYLTEPNEYAPLVGLRFDEVKSSRAIFLASQVPNLTTLDVRSPEAGVSPKHCDFSHLESLTLAGFDEPQLEAWLRVADQLDVLHLFGVDQITTGSYRSIGSAKTLTYLSLRGVDLSPEDLAQLSVLPNLRHLSLADCRIHVDAYAEFNRFPGLDSLSLSGKTYNDATVDDVAGLRRITDLSFEDTMITDRGVKKLATMSHLRDLSLYGSQQITEDCIPDLLKMDSLDWLNLLATPIEEHPKLERLSGIMMEWIL
ncbi:MAG: hypothetical protein AAFX06_05195 [Planctomycetota bacterium]